MTQSVARKARVMSGMRPTGELHLGHLVGVLTQWARYSETADAFFEIACPGLWAILPEARRDVPYRANAAELFGDLAMPPYQISRADLAQVRVPCLVIRGSQSDPTLRAIAAILAESIPGARLVELPGSGHVTYAEKPAEFASAVESFASTLQQAHP